MPARRLQVIPEYFPPPLRLGNFPPPLAGEGQGGGPERSDQRRSASRAWRTAIDRLIDRSGGNLDRRADDQEAPARGRGR